MDYRLIIPALWLLWLGVWIMFARWSKPDAERESAASRLSHVVPLLVVAWLLAAPEIPIPLLDARLVPPGMLFVRLGTSVTFAGLAFTVWARVWLAGNWSAAVTVKRGHALVTNGPYAVVRHPIYTGLLVALIGTGLAVGEARAALAIVIAGVALWLKLRREEALMLRAFGDDWRAYASRTAALAPFLL